MWLPVVKGSAPSTTEKMEKNTKVKGASWRDSKIQKIDFFDVFGVILLSS